MYAWQFQDGTYRISFMTNHGDARVYGNAEALKLFDGIYKTRKEAEDSIQRIKLLVKGEEVIK